MDIYKQNETINSFLTKKEIDKDRYVFLVPFKFYEYYVDMHYLDSKYDIRPFIYFKGVRMMWSKKVDKIKLITKKWYNKKYNECSFVKVV